jgi:hypothetical protein
MRRSSLTVSTEFDHELTDSMIDDPEIFNLHISGDSKDKDRFTKKSHLMSTKISKENQSSLSMVKKDSNRSYVSQNSRFSINSEIKEDNDTDSKHKMKSRKSQIDVLRAPNFGTIIENEGEHSKAFIPKQSKKSKNKAQHNSTPINLDFGDHDYFQTRLEQRRTHHSPDDVLHRKKRRSTWKCNLKDMESKKRDIRMTINQLGLDD